MLSCFKSLSTNQLDAGIMTSGDNDLTSLLLYLIRAWGGFAISTRSVILNKVCSEVKNDAGTIFRNVKIHATRNRFPTLLFESVFSLAKRVQIILEISATYRLVSYMCLLSDKWLICRLCAQCMISDFSSINNVYLSQYMLSAPAFSLTDNAYLVFDYSRYNKNLIQW